VGRRTWGPPSGGPWLALALVALASASLEAHGVSGKDAVFLQGLEGRAIVPLMYLGAKHMVTGYDHLLFLTGVIFFLYRMRDVAIYVTLFSLGHSATLLAGVLMEINVNPFLIDAIIGLSVVYKAFDNLDGFKSVFGIALDNRIAVAVFGLFHGFGLATKLQALNPAKDGLVANMVAFNVGVEIGQLLALSLILLAMVWVRRLPGFPRAAVAANVALMAAGFVLMEYQLAGYVAGASAA
jgi:hypothetical protein